MKDQMNRLATMARRMVALEHHRLTLSRDIEALHRQLQSGANHAANAARTESVASRWGAIESAFGSAAVPFVRVADWSEWKKYHAAIEQVVRRVLSMRALNGRQPRREPRVKPRRRP